MVYTLSNPPKESNKIVLQPLPPDPATIRKDVYASIHGTTYYPWWCDAGKTIIKKNIIWYETPEEAKKAGYRITKRCR